MNISKILCLILYYGFARYLPKSYAKPFGPAAKWIRYKLCSNIFNKTGRSVNIERKAWFGKGNGIEIGDRSGIGINCRIHPNTIIGKDVMMGPNCYMLDSNHIFERTDISMIDQGMKPVSKRCKVIIEDDVWIGRDVMIIGSKTIKRGSIIGARTVLTKNFPEYSIIGGNPSSLIRSRI